jgi:DUF971 family protein
MLEIEFDDGNRFTYTAEYLRVQSPSAEVKGHGSSQRYIVAGCRSVGIKSIEPVGNYAIRIVFDDHHDTGIYSWNYLYELGEKRDENWLRYTQMLQSLGLSRDSYKV